MSLLSSVERDLRASELLSKRQSLWKSNQTYYASSGNPFLCASTSVPSTMANVVLATPVWPMKANVGSVFSWSNSDGTSCGIQSTKQTDSWNETTKQKQTFLKALNEYKVSMYPTHTVTSISHEFHFKSCKYKYLMKLSGCLFCLSLSEWK